LKKSLFPGCSKRLDCKAQEKVRAEAYWGIRDALAFSQQRSKQTFFNSQRGARWPALDEKKRFPESREAQRQSIGNPAVFVRPVAFRPMVAHGSAFSIF
jgi:hypothetical protein